MHHITHVDLKALLSFLSPCPTKIVPSIESVNLYFEIGAKCFNWNNLVSVQLLLCVVYYYNGLILPLYPVLCCFKRDFYSVSRGSRDMSVLLSLFQYLFQYLFISVLTYISIYLFQYLIIYFSIWFGIYLFQYLLIYFSFYLFQYLFIYFSICFSIYLFQYLLFIFISSSFLFL